MVQSIELLLDPDAEASLRGQWAALSDAGLPSLASHTGETNRPHVTLAVAEDGLDVHAAALSAVARGWDLAGRGLPVVVGAPLLLGGHRHRWALARQIVPSRPLLTLHSAVHRALRGTEVDPRTRPDAWTPHLTLALRMPEDRLPEALALLDHAPLEARIAGLRLWDSPSRTVAAL